MNLATKYLGLTLAHPFMVGASPLADTLDSVKRLEDAGSAAIVLRSIFEEQVTLARFGSIHHMDPLQQAFVSSTSRFPASDRYRFAPDEYLRHIARVKAAVAVPVIASLNGTSGESWLTFATEVADAGADAMELNVYDVVTSPDQSAAWIEREIRDMVAELKACLMIPVAVKLGPFFTAFGHFAAALAATGADGLVLFNRFYQLDIDTDTMAAVARVDLSTSSELLLRLRWVADLRSSLRCSLAITGGVASVGDGIKALLAGADAVQMVSAILRLGPRQVKVMRQGLLDWMESKQFTSLDEVRGRVSEPSGTNPMLSERAAYIRTLQSWTNQAEATS
jgi:dihydroorotate dehydrogenase (fumarate)